MSDIEHVYRVCIVAKERSLNILFREKPSVRKIVDTLQNLSNQWLLLEEYERPEMELTYIEALRWFTTTLSMVPHVEEFPEITPTTPLRMNSPFFPGYILISQDPIL